MFCMVTIVIIVGCWQRVHLSIHLSSACLLLSHLPPQIDLLRGYTGYLRQPRRLERLLLCGCPPL